MSGHSGSSSLYTQSYTDVTSIKFSHACMIVNIEDFGERKFSYIQLLSIQFKRHMHVFAEMNTYRTRLKNVCMLTILN
jgi:hypothetical protein